jgi:hypothetical protein
MIYARMEKFNLVKDYGKSWKFSQASKVGEGV